MFNEDDLELDYEVPELGSDEDELEDEENELDESGVVDLVDDEEYEKQHAEMLFYQGFPKIEDIYKEGKEIEEMPDNYTSTQRKLYRKGVEQIKAINAKYKCNLSFSALVIDMNERYTAFQKNPSEYSNMFESMSYALWHTASSYAIQMEMHKAYSVAILLYKFNGIKSCIIYPKGIDLKHNFRALKQFKPHFFPVFVRQKLCRMVVVMQRDTLFFQDRKIVIHLINKRIHLNLCFV